MTFKIPLVSLNRVETNIKQWLKESIADQDAMHMADEVLKNALTDRLVAKYLVDNGFAKFSMTGEQIAEFQMCRSLKVPNLLGNLIMSSAEGEDVQHKAIELQSTLTKDLDVKEIIEDYANNLVLLRTYQGTPRISRYEDPEYIDVSIPVNLTGAKLKLDDLTPEQVMDTVTIMMAREAMQLNKFTVPVRIFGKSSYRLITRDIPDLVHDLVKEIRDEAEESFKQYFNGQAKAGDINAVWQAFGSGQFNSGPACGSFDGFE